jgi:tetratricopeptide (TPR) repeat protein
MDRFDWLEFDVAKARKAQVRGFPAQPNDGPSYYRAARRMRESGHFKAASEFYEKAIGFSDQHYGAWAELIDTLVRARHLEAAAVKCEEALTNYGQVRMFYACRALVWCHSGRVADAFSYSDVSLEGNDQSWYTRCVRAELLLRQSRANRHAAVDCLEEAFRLANNQWEPHFLGAWMFLDAELPVLAAGFAAEAARFEPRAPMSWLLLGDCFEELRLYDQAMFYYQRVLELEGTHELGLARQRRCAPKTFGLLRVFRRENVRERWNREFEKLVERWDPTMDDF